MTSEDDSGLPGIQRGSRGADTTLSRDDALNQVRSAMSAATGLLPVAEAAALAIGGLMAAWETTVTLIDGDQYWDVVDVCTEPDGWPRFPDYRYPLARFPVGTELMMTGRGYVTGDAVDEVIIEFERQWPEVPVGSIMSVPIVALARVHGEIFLVREVGSPHFTSDDLDLCCDLATLLGARLPALVTAYFERHGGVISPSLPDLARELNDPVD